MLEGEVAGATGWAVNGFQATVALWIWSAVVLLFGLWRSLYRSKPDAVRESGPTE